MNKRFKRVIQPGFRLYFLVMLIFTIVTFFFDPRVFAAELLILGILFYYYRAVNRHRQREIMRYIENISYHVDTATKDSMLNFPMPMVIVKLDSGEVIWSNDRFNSITGEHDHLFEMHILDVVPGFDTRWIMEGKTECPYEVSIGKRKYTVFGSVVRSAEGGMRGLLGTLYWMDTTESAEMRTEYALSRPVVCMIVLDNYDELMKDTSYPVQSSLLASIDSKIVEWTAQTEGILKKYERDRYLLVFEERFLPKLVETRFSVLDSVREIVSPTNMPATVSIGIGKDDPAFKGNYQQATLAIDMALSRGGDQAVIKNHVTFEFYGGRSKELEKRTKVKSRVMANALAELISDASNVLVMGHKLPDIDSIGAAVGIMCAARKRQRQCRIVCDTDQQSAELLIKRLLQFPEYEKAFISVQDAMLMADNHTLLVVVDTNRPEYAESQELLQACTRVAVIDHHRRAATYIEHAALNFHEPYASSTCELVCELLQYIVDTPDILRCEAEALLGGIVLDTKNFSMHTGVRTFEAAAFLRRAGADTLEIKKIFQSDLQSCIRRYEIIKEAQMYSGNIAIAAVDSPVDRIIAAQAADELIDVIGVEASFVLFSSGDTIVASARSLGKVNVQLIMEKLGGGGHMMNAGAQIKGETLETVRARLIDTIDVYLKENPQQ